MGERIEKSDLRRIAEIFVRHGVEFIVIGGQAEVLMGGAMVTYGVDRCYHRTRDNLERLAAALKEIKPKLRGAPPDVPIVLDVHALSLGNNYTFETQFATLDLLGWVEPLDDFNEVVKHAETYPVGDLREKRLGSMI